MNYKKVRRISSENDVPFLLAETARITVAVNSELVAAVIRVWMDGFAAKLHHAGFSGLSIVGGGRARLEGLPPGVEGAEVAKGTRGLVMWSGVSSRDFGVWGMEWK